MGRPPKAVHRPAWFSLDRYAVAADLDATDWLLNLHVRQWLARELDDPDEWGTPVGGRAVDAASDLICKDIAVLRRNDPATREALSVLQLLDPPWPGRPHATAFIGDFLADPPRLAPSVRPVDTLDLYFFEAMLPPPVRAEGTEFFKGTGRWRIPPELSGRLDHAFPKPMLGRFVTLDLAQPDYVLVHDLLAFLKRERAELAPLGGPYRESLRMAGKRYKPNLGTLARRQVLPFLDLERYRQKESVKWSDYDLAERLLHISRKELKETRELARLAMDFYALYAWIGPIARGVPPRSRSYRGGSVARD